ncbi:MAG TPA: adenylate kinase [bacterium]|nr:adenylate kinase [bacterium]
MNIVFIGMPGSGKGTQAQKLAQKLSLPFISTGDLFRSQIEKQTEIGQKVKQIIDAGNLVSDDITFELLKQGIQDFDISKGVVLDGFPRNLNQAKMLDEYLKIDKVININLSETEIMVRIGGRRTCICGATYHIKFNPPKVENICDVCKKELFVRDDAKEESIKTRIEIYRKNADPLLDFYRQKGIVIDIDGDPAIDNVENEINQKLSL